MSVISNLHVFKHVCYNFKRTSTYFNYVLKLKTDSHSGIYHTKMSPMSHSSYFINNHYFTSRHRELEYGAYVHHIIKRNFSAKHAVEVMPLNIQPYLKLLRADKPIGTWLLLWPSTWGISLASGAGHLPDFYLLALFSAGAFLMRGSGCIINDIWDRDIDKKVSRTMSRPLAHGDLSMTQAVAFLAMNLSLSLTILLQLNWYSVFLGAASLSLVVSYPYMKRITYWPQLALGLTFNYGILLGWSAVKGSIDWSSVLPLYISAVSWTLLYDTIYAHQDKEDDVMIGVKSTALKFGDDTKLWLSAFSGVMLSGLVTTGYLTGQIWPYWTSVSAVALHLSQQIWSVDLDNADDCGAKFRSNTLIGAMLFVGIAASMYLKTDNADKVECGVDTTDNTECGVDTTDNV